MFSFHSKQQPKEEEEKNSSNLFPFMRRCWLDTRARWRCLIRILDKFFVQNTMVKTWWRRHTYCCVSSLSFFFFRQENEITNQFWLGKYCSYLQVIYLVNVSHELPYMVMERMHDACHDRSRTSRNEIENGINNSTSTKFKSDVDITNDEKSNEQNIFFLVAHTGLW